MSGVGQIPNRSQMLPPPTADGGDRAAEYASGLTDASSYGLARSVAARVAAWIEGHDALLELEREWQCNETALFAKARRQRISFDAALESDLAEAQEMRSRDRLIKALRAKLDADAFKIRSTPSSSIACAVAKLELGLNVQGPFDWRDHALELVHDGIRELRALL